MPVYPGAPTGQVLALAEMAVGARLTWLLPPSGSGARRLSSPVKDPPRNDVDHGPVGHGIEPRRSDCGSTYGTAGSPTQPTPPCASTAAFNGVQLIAGQVFRSGRRSPTRVDPVRVGGPGRPPPKPGPDRVDPAVEERALSCGFGHEGRALHLVRRSLALPASDPFAARPSGVVRSELVQHLVSCGRPWHPGRRRRCRRTPGKQPAAVNASPCSARSLVAGGDPRVNPA